MAFSTIHSDRGLFGIYGTVVQGQAGEFIKVCASTLGGLSSIKPDEVARAKNALKTSIHMSMESKQVAMEDTGRQLIMSGKVGSPTEFAAMIDKVKDADLAAVAKKCLATKPTLVAYGDISQVPHYDAVAAAMGSASSGAPKLPKAEAKAKAA